MANFINELNELIEKKQKELLSKELLIDDLLIIEMTQKFCLQKNLRQYALTKILCALQGKSSQKQTVLNSFP